MGQSVQQQQQKTILNASSSTMLNMSTQQNAQQQQQQIINISQQQQQKVGDNAVLSRTSTPTLMSSQMQAQAQAQLQATGQAAASQQNPSPMDLLKCLRKFLHTLLDLANNSLPEKYPLVRNLIQDLLVGF